eukprot:CAMPEP_0182446296 /NCGR_PEP_ID=MMETSP1172-20130603/4116_1 /TAXON_ID=708627 /ORGANISM="Timspurckia oligopyrenoides, Strain CCMP3278" /LENGTH=86 /DNA_ID=CAMNT_0024642209 /DNA_START=504 /DNA_END=764 /DNA_ORIENTATION=-
MIDLSVFYADFYVMWVLEFSLLPVYAEFDHEYDPKWTEGRVEILNEATRDQKASHSDRALLVVDAHCMSETAESGMPPMEARSRPG